LHVVVLEVCHETVWFEQHVWYGAIIQLEQSLFHELSELAPGISATYS